jgi:AraC family transcriptional regulator, ethanolamine operon transcriptional activator
MAQLIFHESGDVDEQADFLAGYRQVYEQLGRGRFRGQLWQRLMSSGIAFRESTNRQLRQQVHPPADHVAIAVALSAQSGALFAGRALTPASVMVLTGQEQHEISAFGALDVVGISVHRDLLAGLAEDQQAWLARALRLRHLVVAPATAAAIGKTLQLQLAEAGDAAPAPLACTLAQAVALAMSGEDPASRIPRRFETRLKVVRRAIDYLQAHLAEDIGTADICKAACASRRSLQYCFEEFLQTTPLEYLRALRLNQARRRLKCGGAAPVTVIATGLGFNSASHFTRQYRSMFDELPSQTSRRMRDSAAAHRPAALP